MVRDGGLTREVVLLETQMRRCELKGMYVLARRQAAKLRDIHLNDEVTAEFKLR